jgi:hypothetical protein
MKSSYYKAICAHLEEKKKSYRSKKKLKRKEKPIMLLAKHTTPSKSYFVYTDIQVYVPL